MKKIIGVWIILVLGAGYAFGQGYGSSSDPFDISGSTSSSYPSHVLESLYGRSDYFSTDTREIPSVPDSVAYQYEPVEFFTSPIFQYKEVVEESGNLPYYLTSKGITYPANPGSVYDPGFIDAAQSAASSFQTAPIPAPAYTPPSTPYD